VQAFEELWDQAEPARSAVPPGPGGGPAPTAAAAAGSGSELNEQEVALLRMLADDMTETAIGRHVGASARTVGRRVARLHRKLDARTRFSLGVQAARRGIL
jgi:DNA-binding NarL/FixJ family response regulator